MINKILLTLCCGILLQACAGTPPAGQPSAAEREQARSCVQSTGSHIARKSGECQNSAGYSVSREELERGGRGSLGGNLGVMTNTR